MESTSGHAGDADGKGVLMKADAIAETFRAEVLASLAECARPPKLVGILSTSSASSKSYAVFTKKQCEDLGVDFILKSTGAAVAGNLGESEGVEEAIIEANEDESVDGILVCHIDCNLRIILLFQSGVLSDLPQPAGRSQTLDTN